jgi:hypothetical protein
MDLGGPLSIETIKSSEVIERMLLELDLNGWTQGQYENSFGQMCIKGAQAKAIDTQMEWAPNRRLGALYHMHQALEESIREFVLDDATPHTAFFGTSVAGFNDSDHTMYHHVVTVLKRAHDKLVERNL